MSIGGRLAGTVALITGAGRGQGRSHALTLAAEGAAIAALDLGDQRIPGRIAATATGEDLAETVRRVKDLGGRIIGIEADVRDEEQVAAAIATTFAELGPIDTLVANAAVFSAAQPFWEINLAEWQTVLDVDLTGVWLCCKHVAPLMMERRRGSIILISSNAGMRSVPQLSGYSAAKWGVRGLAQCMANELGEYGIRVNSVHPATTDTPALDAMSALMGRTREDNMGYYTASHIFKNLIDPADVSRAVLFLASDDARNITGIALPVDAGSSAHA
jgi:SDR family mycofactocin-dependent oxidoreductase